MHTKQVSTRGELMLENNTPDTKIVTGANGQKIKLKKQVITKVQNHDLVLPYEVGKALRDLPIAERKAYCLLLVEGNWTLQSIANELFVHRQTVLDYTRSAEANNPDVLAKVWDLPVPKLPRIVVSEKYVRDIVEIDSDVLKQLIELQPMAQLVRSHSPKYREEAETYTKLLAQEIDRGVTSYQLSKALGITIGAISFRLTRYGYKPLGTGKSKAYNSIIEKNRKKEA